MTLVHDDSIINIVLVLLLLLTENKADAHRLNVKEQNFFIERRDAC